MLPLTGTSSPKHMSEDLASSSITLSADEVVGIETVAG
jgi:aryl-alcohol dehydrogenase-like predicted oxidoreductase